MEINYYEWKRNGNKRIRKNDKKYREKKSRLHHQIDEYKGDGSGIIP